MYDLCTDGLSAFYARRPSAKRLVRREPLVGIVNGYNTVFLTSHRPVLYESLIIYSADAPLLPVGFYSFDADGGVVQLAAPPSIQAVADYTAVPLTARQIIDLAWAGYDLMQSLWSRNYFLSSDTGTYLAADNASAHIYVCEVQGTTPNDPVIASGTFSTLPRQRAFLARCIEFAFLDAAMTDAALSDVAIKERFGGIAVDPTKRTRNLIDAKMAQWEELLRAMYAAQDEQLGGDQYVQDVVVPHTSEYVSTYQWQYDVQTGLPTRWWKP